MSHFITLENLGQFLENCKSIFGGSLVIEGTTIKLVADDGTTVLATQTIPQKEYSPATQTANGLMSSTDKTKLDGISTGANKTEKSATNGNVKVDGTEVKVYVHPSYTAAVAGLYKITVDASGHVSLTAAVTKDDITALGIPGQDTTYNDATQSVHGLMSTSDKAKLDGIATGAQVNVIESVKLNGGALTVTGKSVNIDLSAYALKTDISAAVNYRGTVASYADLPSNPSSGDMYNVETADAEHGISAGENVVWNGSSWDAVGASFVIETATTGEIDALFA